MRSSKLPVGSYVRIDKPQLQTIVEQLRERGYRTHPWKGAVEKPWRRALLEFTLQRVWRAMPAA